MMQNKFLLDKIDRRGRKVSRVGGGKFSGQDLETAEKEKLCYRGDPLSHPITRTHRRQVSPGGRTQMLFSCSAAHNKMSRQSCILSMKDLLLSKVQSVSHVFEGFMEELKTRCFPSIQTPRNFRSAPLA